MIATGTMSGALFSTQLSPLTYSVPAGAVPGYPNCTIDGTGSATVTAGVRITGTLQTTFSNCSGSGLATPDSAQLTLTKQ